jgi:hypothetical protein
LPSECRLWVFVAPPSQAAGGSATPGRCGQGNQSAKAGTMNKSPSLAVLSAEIAVVVISSAVVVLCYALIANAQQRIGTYLPLAGGMLLAAAVGTVVAKRLFSSWVVSQAIGIVVAVSTLLLSTGVCISLYGS